MRRTQPAAGTFILTGYPASQLYRPTLSQIMQPLLQITILAIGVVALVIGLRGLLRPDGAQTLEAMRNNSFLSTDALIVARETSANQRRLVVLLRRPDLALVVC
jgi:hypothetical protein